MKGHRTHDATLWLPTGQVKVLVLQIQIDYGCTHRVVDAVVAAPVILHVRRNFARVVALGFGLFPVL